MTASIVAKVINRPNESNKRLHLRLNFIPICSLFPFPIVPWGPRNLWDALPLSSGIGIYNEPILMPLWPAQIEFITHSGVYGN